MNSMNRRIVPSSAKSESRRKLSSQENQKFVAIYTVMKSRKLILDLVCAGTVNGLLWWISGVGLLLQAGNRRRSSGN